MIPFNFPPYFDSAEKYLKQVIASGHVSGDGHFTALCSKWMEERCGAQKAMLTTSCTHALEMAALLCGISQGDEVIMPSYTFSSTANAFVLAGAVPVFIDIRPDTMNMDERLLEEAITEKTKAICVVHYAGVACEMDAIMQTAKRYGLYVIEDAAQGIMSAYKGRELGTIGDFGCFSFHETKNYTMGEGGALLVNKESFNLAAEIMREKGTNRSQFFRGMVDKYSWIDKGSSYLPGELNAAYLWSQLENAEKMNNRRLSLWEYYRAALVPLAERGVIELPVIPEHCKHNAHMFWIKMRDMEVRSRLIEYLKGFGIDALFHYIPLHSAPAGLKFGRFSGCDRYTTAQSERLLRLPMYYDLEQTQQKTVVDKIADFFR